MEALQPARMWAAPERRPRLLAAQETSIKVSDTKRAEFFDKEAGLGFSSSSKTRHIPGMLVLFFPRALHTKPLVMARYETLDEGASPLPNNE